jgi:hypothetical protein
MSPKPQLNREKLFFTEFLKQHCIFGVLYYMETLLPSICFIKIKVFLKGVPVANQIRKNRLLWSCAILLAVCGAWLRAEPECRAAAKAQETPPVKAACPESGEKAVSALSPNSEPNTPSVPVKVRLVLQGETVSGCPKVALADNSFAALGAKTTDDLNSPANKIAKDIWEQTLEKDKTYVVGWIADEGWFSHHSQMFGFISAPFIAQEGLEVSFSPGLPATFEYDVSELPKSIWPKEVHLLKKYLDDGKIKHLNCGLIGRVSKSGKCTICGLAAGEYQIHAVTEIQIFPNPILNDIREITIKIEENHVKAIGPYIDTTVEPSDVTIIGKLVDQNELPMPSKEIYLVPIESSFNFKYFYPKQITDSDGGFTFVGVNPKFYYQVEYRESGDKKSCYSIRPEDLKKETHVVLTLNKSTLSSPCRKSGNCKKEAVSKEPESKTTESSAVSASKYLPNGTTVASAVNRVRESENWVHKVDSFYLKIDGSWFDSTGKTKKSSDILEFAFDKNRVRVLCDDPLWYQLNIWTGNQFIGHEKMPTYNKEFYLLHYTPQNRFKQFVARDIPWFTSQPHSFWFDLKDVNSFMAIYGLAEDFSFTGKTQYRGIDCYSLSLPAGKLDSVWFVGVNDGILYGSKRYKDGKLWIERWMLDYKEVAPNCWLPFTMGYETYHNDSNETSSLPYRRDLKVVQCTVNQPLSEELFKIQFKDGVKVHDHRYGHLMTYPYKADRTEQEWMELIVSSASNANAGFEKQQQEAVPHPDQPQIAVETALLFFSYSEAPVGWSVENPETIGRMIIAKADSNELKKYFEPISLKPWHLNLTEPAVTETDPNRCPQGNLSPTTRFDTLQLTLPKVILNSGEFGSVRQARTNDLMVGVEPTVDTKNNKINLKFCLRYFKKIGSDKQADPNAPSSETPDFRIIELPAYIAVSSGKTAAMFGPSYTDTDSKTGKTIFVKTLLKITPTLISPDKQDSDNIFLRPQRENRCGD